MADLPDAPLSREEDYLASIAGQNVEVPPCPRSRKEAYLDAIDTKMDDIEEDIENLKNNPDVVDVVNTYADLQAYDKTKLTDNDIIRVLNDETHDGGSTYYRYSTATQTFTYIGMTKQYTNFVGTDGTTAGKAGLVPAPATTDAGKVLKADGTWGESSPTQVQTSWAETDSTSPAYFVTPNRFGSRGGYLVSEVSTNAETAVGGVTYNVVLGISGYRIGSSTSTSMGSLGLDKSQFDSVYITGGKGYRIKTMVGATASTAGTAGLVPAPAATDADKFLKADGTWDEVGSGITELSEADFDYPSNHPSGVALWNLDAGIYIVKPTAANRYLRVYYGSSTSYIDNLYYNTVIIVSGATDDARTLLVITNLQVKQVIVQGHGTNVAQGRLTTKEYVDGLVGDVESALQTINNGGN